MKQAESQSWLPRGKHCLRGSRRMQCVFWSRLIGFLARIERPKCFLFVCLFLITKLRYVDLDQDCLTLKLWSLWMLPPHFIDRVFPTWVGHPGERSRKVILDGMNIKAPIFQRLLQISVFFTRVRTRLFKVAFYRRLIGAAWTDISALTGRQVSCWNTGLYCVSCRSQPPWVKMFPWENVVRVLCHAEVPETPFPRSLSPISERQHGVMERVLYLEQEDMIPSPSFPDPWVEWPLESLSASQSLYPSDGHENSYFLCVLLRLKGNNVDGTALKTLKPLCKSEELSVTLQSVRLGAPYYTPSTWKWAFTPRGSVAKVSGLSVEMNRLLSLSCLGVSAAKAPISKGHKRQDKENLKSRWLQNTRTLCGVELASTRGAANSRWWQVEGEAQEEAEPRAMDFPAQGLGSLYLFYPCTAWQPNHQGQRLPFMATVTC